jgi:hypothetical protein
MSTYVAVFAMVLAYVALVGAYVALRTLAKVRRSTAVLARTTGTDGTVRSLAEATERQATETALLAEHVADLRAWAEQRFAHTESTSAAAVAAAVAAVRPSDDEVGALRNIALVRYDAFSDMSGRLSFSLALLDRGGDGVVISAIVGRSDTRVYAKGVAAGRGEHELSPEEQQAVASAMNERRGGILQRKAG